MSDVHLECPYHAIIPYSVQVDKSISSSEKLFFGQIVGLSRKFGYIWATDEQLSEMVETPIDTIGKWLKNLENAGHLKRETEMHYLPNEKKDGIKQFIKKRKIYILDNGNIEKVQKDQEKNNSKKDCRPVKNDDSIEPVKNDDSMNPSKMTDITSNSKEEFKTTKPGPVVFPSLSRLNIEQSLAQKISNENSEEDVAIAVERCLSWGTRPSDKVGILTALQKKDSWEDRDSTEETIRKNTEYLKTLEKYDGKTFRCGTIQIGPDYFQVYNSNCVVHYFKVDEPDFIVKIKALADKK